MLSRTFLPLIAIGASAVAAYNPYSGESYDLYARDADYDNTLIYGDIFGRDAEPEEDHLSHIYSRDLDVRHLQIRDDMEALLRVRELAARDPELLRYYQRGLGHKVLGAAGGAMVAAATGQNKVLGAAAGLGVAAIKDHMDKKNSAQGGGACPAKKSHESNQEIHDRHECERKNGMRSDATKHAYLDH